METKTNHTIGGQHNDQQYSARFCIPEAEANTPETKMIRIIDGQYNEKFRVADGGYINVDGKPYQVHYCDETHFRIGSAHYHICQFGERVIDRGRDVRPHTMEG